MEAPRIALEFRAWVLFATLPHSQRAIGQTHVYDYLSLSYLSLSTPSHCETNSRASTLRLEGKLAVQRCRTWMSLGRTNCVA
jgi:hypothetical protein